MLSFILCGMQFGDEGKGTFVDYLAYEQDIDSVVRYNGGAQASHTVITPSNNLHKFSQLGSGMFLEKCHTYITENMVVNLDSLLVEIGVFSGKTGISISDLTDRIHIHEDCFVVTPYHKLINRLRELAKGDSRRGSVGTGVSEVKYLLAEPKSFPYEPPLGLCVKDIFDPYADNLVVDRLRTLQEYVSQFYETNKEAIWKNVPEEMRENLEKEIEFLLLPDAFRLVVSSYERNFKYAPRFVNLKKCIYNSYELTLRKNCQSAIFEGSQGLLIDGKYGIKPNTTFLDTTNHFALKISCYIDNITKIGIIKAFTSRHGLGVFPTESSEVSSKICDENQDESFWNGKIRFGWFDSVLFSYAQEINNVEELFLSSLDKLDSFEEIKVCTGYHYDGVIDEEFENDFAFFTDSDGQVVITDIVRNSENLSGYLSRCIPMYISVKGWMSKISDITDKKDLPAECLEYIAVLERVTGLHISIVSVGPTRQNKIRM